MLTKNLQGLVACGWLVVCPVLRAAEPVPVEKNSALKLKLETVFSRFLRRSLTIERLRWKFFPLKMAGTNLKLWEAPNVLMAQAPQATLTMSLKTLTSGRLRVGEMRFKDAQMYLRFTHDGKTNITSMIADLAAFARKNYKRGQKQKVAYNLFRIENATLEVIDAETGNRPFVDPFLVNATGDIGGLGPQTQFPFHVEAVLASTQAATRAEIKGVMSNRPRAHIEVRHVPVSVLNGYLPVARWFQGEANAEFDFSKAGAYAFWKLRVLADEIKTSMAAPFPLIKVDGFFHPYAPSKLNVTFEGKPTRFDVEMNIKDLVAKKVWLSVRSREADLAECLAWCHTGYLMGQGPLTPEQVHEKMNKPLIWRVTGKADIEANLASALGPRLIREADGQITINIRDGKLIEMPGFVKALGILKMSSLLRQEDGLPFKTVGGIIDIKDGVAQTRHQIVLDNPLLNVGFMGRVNFPKQVINARIRLGAVWFTVKGPLDNPVVQREKS